MTNRLSQDFSQIDRHRSRFTRITVRKLADRRGSLNHQRPGAGVQNPDLRGAMGQVECGLAVQVLEFVVSW
jgi:hypothetical protein